MNVFLDYTVYCFLLQRNISDMAENMRQFFGEFVNKKKRQNMQGGL